MKGVSSIGVYGSLLVFLLLVGCASNKTYRTDLISTCSLSDKDCDASLEISGGTAESSQIALAYIEINDQGLLRERGQLDRVRSLITSRGMRGNQAVMVFVHGWHNNAQADNKNVQTFRRLLKRYAELNPTVLVTGVYVGWRGDSWLLPSFVSFWDRKSVSIEIGQSALVDTISIVEKASIETKSRMVSIGHSFGGSALFNATRSILLSRLDSPPLAFAHEEFPMHAAVGDLIVIVNPAFEAMQYWPLHSATLDRISKTTPVPDRGPRMLILQGQRDWATRYAFPAGRSLTAPFQSFADDSDSTDFVKQPLSEWRLDLFAIGHFKELNTHELLDLAGAATDFSKCGHEVDSKGFANGAWSSPNAKVRLNPRSNFVKGYPFWIVYDTLLSSGHNDLEDGRLTCMVADLISTYTRTEPLLFR
ncbi:MAG TPA: hypothetical protein VFV57_02675 [Limnobacter sp.]|nr:hypothetical protein [Limnobacter sp.]